MSKFNIGDKVEIIPHKDHPQFVRNHYGKTLEVEDVIEMNYDKFLYKVKGIKDYATDVDLKLLNGNKQWKQETRFKKQK